VPYLGTKSKLTGTAPERANTPKKMSFPGKIGMDQNRVETSDPQPQNYNQAETSAVAFCSDAGELSTEVLVS
jgi:hypothetical protein